MTNAEAIETLRANYPDACFEQLRCAVDMAINALTKEAWKEEHPVSPLLQKLATNLQSSKQDADDTISRQAAIDALMPIYKSASLRNRNVFSTARKCMSAIEELPSTQPERLTDDDFETIRIHLNAYKEKLCNQQRWEEADEYQRILDRFMSFASVQPERTCVNCGRTANNGGWYADGGTRCPIEEHYALPKDGFCHLWEKRNVADDDYPERRTDE